MKILSLNLYQIRLKYRSGFGLYSSSRRVCRHQQSLKNIDDLTATHLLGRIILNKHNIYYVAIFCQNSIRIVKLATIQLTLCGRDRKAYC